MNARATWTWLIVAASLLAFILINHRYASPRSQAGPARLLPQLRADAVTSLQVRPPGTNQLEIHAQRVEGAWQLTEPVHYPAQGIKIAQLLAYLEKLTPATTITAAEIRARPTAEEEFGLTSLQAASLILSQPDYRVQLLLGARTAPGDQVFIQIVGQEGAFVVDAELLNLVPRAAAEWRDTSILALKPGAYNLITVTNGAKVFELELDAATGLWRLVRPFPARAHQARIRESVEVLQALQVQSFVSDDPAADLEPFGLQSPPLQIAFRQGTNLVAALQFGASPTNKPGLVFGRRLGAPTIFTVLTDPLTAWRASFNEFRDPHLVALTDPVDAVEVRSETPFSLEQQEGDQWRVLPAGFSADPDLVRELLGTLSGLQIAQFVKDVVTEPDLPAYGLAAPLRQFVLKTSVTNAAGLKTNVVLADLHFGVSTNQTDRVYVRRTDESFVYAITTADFLRLPAAPWQLRERRLWDFQVTNVASVVIRQDGRTRKILHRGAHDWSLAPGSQGVINDLAIEETVRALARASAAVWVACGEEYRARYGFTTNSHQITLELKTGATATIEFGGEAPSQYQYAAVTLDGQLWICEFPRLLYRDIVSYLSVPPGV